MSDMPPGVKVEPVTKSLLERMSVVWIIPLLALIIALGVAWQSYSEQGPLITIEFENGAGIAAGQTDLRYRDITVGRVEDIGFSDGLSSVLVSVRIDKAVAPYVDNGASFWVVRPELTARGVSGLDTVLSGVFIEGTWDDQIGTTSDIFKGLNEAPLIRPGHQGLQIALRTSATGQLTDNAPIIYRGIEVGRIGKARISPNGNFAVAEAIINEPHGRLITSSTRFWDTSGFTVSIGARGAEVDFSSIASLVSGGITFDTFVSGGRRVADGTTFEVFADIDTARQSVFNASEVETLELQAIFEDNIAGLSVGAPVELAGLNIGQVSNLTGMVDRSAFGDSRVRLNVTLSIQPAKLGLQEEVTPEAALSFLSESVRSTGLRARLATASILTGGLKVELVRVEGAPDAEIDQSAEPFPQIPSSRSEISDVAATAEGVFQRINALPIEELLNSAISFISAMETLVSSPELREAPAELRGLLGDVRGLVGSPEIKDVPVQISAVLKGLNDVLARIETAQTVEKLVAAVDAATAAASSVGTAVDGVPSLIAALNAVADKAASVPIDTLAKDLSNLVTSAETLISSEDTAALPASLTTALAEIEATLRELREGGAVENTNRTLASARDAADAVALSAKDLPAMIERMNRLLTQASVTLQSYDGGSELNRGARSTLRDIQEAADAVSALARTIQRNPNSLLLGR